MPGPVPSTLVCSAPRRSERGEELADPLGGVSVTVMASRVSLGCTQDTDIGSTGAVVVNGIDR